MLESMDKTQTMRALREGGIYRLPDTTRFVARGGTQGTYDLFTTQELMWQIRQATYRTTPTGGITYAGKPTPWTTADLIDTGRTIQW